MIKLLKKNLCPAGADDLNAEGRGGIKVVQPLPYKNMHVFRFFCVFLLGACSYLLDTL